MNVFLTSLGCRLNEAELQTWSNEFASLGLGVTNDVTQASLIVINTCAVTGEAARKSRQTIRRYHRKNPIAKLVVTGCYASLEKTEAESLLGVDLLVPNQDKDKLPERAKELLEWETMPYAATEPDESALFVRNRERAFIKVQDGCRYRCTYCIVTIARGEEKSRSIKSIIDEINLLNSQGIQEIVLTGVHVGGYGSDLDTSLYHLVTNILSETKIPRIRFASVEPWDLHQDFFELFRNSRLMPHMHLPIQSGSNKLLKKMSRRCQTDNYIELINTAKKVVPNFNITTDIIVGFPGETEEDFNDSLDIVAKVEFGHVHTFSFSPREGTKAARLSQQLDNKTKKSRSQLMHTLSNQIKKKQLQKMVGETVDVLWEGEGENLGNGYCRFFGYTPNYFKVAVQVNNSIKLSNQITECKIQDVSDTNQLIGEIEKMDLSFEHINIKQI